MGKVFRKIRAIKDSDLAATLTNHQGGLMHVYRQGKQLRQESYGHYVVTIALVVWVIWKAYHG